MIVWISKRLALAIHDRQLAEHGGGNRRLAVDHIDAEPVAELARHGISVHNGEQIMERYRAAGLTVEFLRGENDQAERKEQMRRLAAGEVDVIIGTTILDVGVDCPAIGLLQLAGGGKAEVALRQRIGRCLRRKKIKLNAALCIDYSCNKNSYLAEHARQRRLIIENTPGFVEGIVRDPSTFDWSIFA